MYELENNQDYIIRPDRQQEQSSTTDPPHILSGGPFSRNAHNFQSASRNVKATVTGFYWYLQIKLTLVRLL